MICFFFLFFFFLKVIHIIGLGSSIIFIGLWKAMNVHLIGLVVYVCVYVCLCFIGRMGVRFIGRL